MNTIFDPRESSTKTLLSRRKNGTCYRHILKYNSYSGAVMKTLRDKCKMNGKLKFLTSTVGRVCVDIEDALRDFVEIMLQINAELGRHSILIANSKPSIQVHGHDQSQFLIELARARSSHLSNVRFSVGDSCSVPANRNSYDMVMILGNSFGFYSTEMGDRNMLAEVYRVLQPGGVLLLECTDATFIRENYELINEKWRWLGQDENSIACYQRELSHDGRRLATREIIVATDKGIIKDTSIPVRLYDQFEFTEIFRNVGFVVSEDSFRKWPTALLSGQYGMLKNRVAIKVCKPV